MIFIFGDVTGLHLIGDVIGCLTFFSFGGVIGGEQVRWVSINMQSNKVIIFGKISLNLSPWQRPIVPIQWHGIDESSKIVLLSILSTYPR